MTLPQLRRRRRSAERQPFGPSIASPPQRQIAYSFHNDKKPGTEPGPAMPAQRRTACGAPPRTGISARSSKFRHPSACRPATGRHLGGGERIRTDDLLLAKQALSRLSYTPRPACRRGRAGRGWWAWVDSNYRPHAYQACALTGLSYRPWASAPGRPLPIRCRSWRCARRRSALGYGRDAPAAARGIVR